MAKETAIAYGIEFYVGRRSRDKAISDVKAAGELVNQSAFTSYKKGAQIRQQQHDEAVKKLKDRSAEAMEDLATAREKASKQAAQSFESLKPPSVAQLEQARGKKLSTTELEHYSATFGRELRGMDAAMTDFVNRSGEMGVNLGKGLDTQETMSAFSKADVQDRNRMVAGLESEVKLNEKRLKTNIQNQALNIEEEKRAEKKSLTDKQSLATARRKLTLMKKAKQDTTEQEKVVKKLEKTEEKSRKHLEKQIELKAELIKEMEKIEDLTEGQRRLLEAVKTEHKKLTAEERKYGKLQREIKEEEKKLNRELITQDKQEMMNMKEKNRLMQEYSRHIDDAAEKVGGTLKTAFVIGTAAIAALNYKLMGVVQSFMDFETQLVNANSIWRETNATLFQISDSVVKFGTQFGVEMGNATAGLYQYASAGVSAAEALEMLKHTLKLSMAVQGDHNTLSKLTTQTIMGFNLEFAQAEEVTDKFAHAINMSLIEWDDLASSIKFALPFFISTGQSIDQLLGGLQVLTNRALEAGIAGRGLRQALAEFTQHAEDNSAAFRKLGIDILDMEGNMKPLNEIALEFNETLGDQASDMELMITLMEDLNVRGATAFVHLAQNADEFTAAVNDLSNSAGASHEMAMIQQQSLANQVQVVKTAMLAPFLLSDKIGEEAGYLNEFAMELHGIVDVVEGLFVKTLDDGTVELTKMGELIRDFVIGALREFKDVLVILAGEDGILRKFAEDGHSMTGILHTLTVPLKIVMNLMKHLGSGFLEAVIGFRILNSLIPINSAVLASNLHMMMALNQQKQVEVVMNSMQVKSGKNLIWVKKVEGKWIKAGNHHRVTENQQKQINTVVTNLQTEANNRLNVSATALLKTQMMSKAVMFMALFITQKYFKDSWALAGVIGALAGAYMSYAIALQMVAAGQLEVKAGGTLMGTHGMRILGWGLAAGAAFGIMMQQMMKPNMDEMPDVGSIGDMRDVSVQTLDTGGRYMARRTYDMGGYTQEHGMAMVQQGETIIPKTQNMLSGGASGGITLNIHGDVYDSDNFAEKISEVLPKAIRNTNDIGGI